MKTLLPVAPLALVALPLFSHAQQSAGSAVGLEIPASAAPARGHWLAGAYVSGSYTPVLAPGLAGYGVQPYLRYVLGTRPTGYLRPFVQYTFAPYRMTAYGAAQRYGADGRGLPANLGSAPLAPGYGPCASSSYRSYRSLGAFSVGVPVQTGRSSAVLNIGGSVVEGLLWSLLR